MFMKEVEPSEGALVADVAPQFWGTGAAGSGEALASRCR
jgi:hypothetical protein